MKINVLKYSFAVLLHIAQVSFAQIVIANKDFFFGTTGRIGVGYSPNADGKTGRQMNLNNLDKSEKNSMEQFASTQDCVFGVKLNTNLKTKQQRNFQ